MVKGGVIGGMPINTHIMDLELCISVSVQRQLFCDMQFGLIAMALCMPKNNYLASTSALSEAVTVSFKNTRTWKIKIQLMT